MNLNIAILPQSKKEKAATGSYGLMPTAQTIMEST